MKNVYQRLPDPGEGLRLHLNENTMGCSPKVIEALRRIEHEQVAIYPDYVEVTQQCAQYFGVENEQLLLTNGLDEGIFSAALAYLRHTEKTPESIIIEPAFDMYAACSESVGSRVVTISPGLDFEFPLKGVLGAISDATRVVFLTNPNNPTGSEISHEVIHAITSQVPTEAIVFLDEAYADFSGKSFLNELDRHPNVIIGRTFAKAHGLAAIRIGAVIASPSIINRLQSVVPPYSINISAVIALQTALEDHDYVRWYLAQTETSKQLLYEACDRWGLEYWRSSANFVLVRVGNRSDQLVQNLATRKIFVRDRSHEPGCHGCIRITTGIVEHTKSCIDAMENILCDVP